MAFFRRTLSTPSPELGDSTASSTAPIHKPFVSNKCDHPVNMFPRSFGSLDYTIYKVQNRVQGLFIKKSSSRPFERLKSKGNIIRRRAIFHFLLWFLFGMCLGFTPFVSLTFCFNFVSKQHQYLPYQNFQHLDISKISINEDMLAKAKDEIGQFDNQSFDEDTKINSLLIIATPIYGNSLFEMNRLANTLRLVSPPLLWVVVEMKAESSDVAEILRKSGLVFRHLICKESLADIAVMRNMVLSHVETHKLNGIMFFANHDNIYSIDMFDQMRHVRHFGAWPVAIVGNEETGVSIEGPICNESRVMGWHTNNRVFHSGLAFNTTILWDPNILKPIRFSRSIKQSSQVSNFIGQIVDDESHIEGLPINCSTIMVWHINMESLSNMETSVLSSWFNGLHNLPI